MGPKTILIVEDDPEFRELLTAILKRGDYEVITAKDGAEGYETALEKKPDLIMLDIEMPRMNGYQVCEAVRAEESIKHIPIILITIHSKVNDVVKGLKLGANDHVTKPYDPQEVLIRIESAFKLAEGGAA